MQDGSGSWSAVARDEQGERGRKRDLISRVQSGKGEGRGAFLEASVTVLNTSIAPALEAKQVAQMYKAHLRRVQVILEQFRA